MRTEYSDLPFITCARLQRGDDDGYQSRITSTSIWVTFEMPAHFPAIPAGAHGIDPDPRQGSGELLSEPVECALADDRGGLERLGTYDLFGETRSGDLRIACPWKDNEGRFPRSIGFSWAAADQRSPLLDGSRTTLPLPSIPADLTTDRRDVHGFQVVADVWISSRVVAVSRL